MYPTTIGLMSRVFANGPGDRGSIPGRVMPKTQKMVLDAALLNTIVKWGSRVKWSNPGKGVAPSPRPQCSSYWKGSLLVALEYGRQLYFTYNCMRKGMHKELGNKFEFLSNNKCYMYNSEDVLENEMHKRKFNCCLIILLNKKTKKYPVRSRPRYWILYPITSFLQWLSFPVCSL